MVTTATRRLRKWGLIVLAPYFIIFPATFAYVQHSHPWGLALWCASILPVLPILGVFAIFGRYLSTERDGYRREQIISALLWGAAGCVAVNLLTGYLRIFGWSGRLPPFAEFWVFMACLFVVRIRHIISNRSIVEP